ncbi:MAG: protoporphyrinogen/coproporphyrinogen oxidase, partial [Acidimicrobiales bacterium]
MTRAGTIDVDVAVLGGGPAGLMAALRLARSGRQVVVLERGARVGGMAGSFEVAGVRVDYGSHRLHPVVEPALMGELRRLLGDDLQTRSRKGRIALAGRWMGFPLRVGDMARTMPRSLVARIALETALGPLRRTSSGSAHDVIAARLGPTVARQFYLPYLTKLWGVSPTELSPELADRRVSARSGLAVVKKALRSARPDGGRFLYPRRGFGQISESVADAAVTAGASIELSAAVTGIEVRVDGVEVYCAGGSNVRAATVMSSIPVSVLARLGGAPDQVLAAADRLRHRAMVLAYLVFDADRVSAFDAHYFPELATPVSRLSEPKNFRVGDDPAGVTVMCAELACWEGDDTWTAPADRLAETVMGTLEPYGFRWPRLVGAEVRRIPRCYPSYSGTYADDLRHLEAWTGTLDRVLTFGRQGLFTPDNTHHALYMGWEAEGAVRADGTLD